MKNLDLLCLVFSDLERWERQAVEPLLTKLMECGHTRVEEVDRSHRNYFGDPREAQNYWVICRHLSRAMNYLGVRKDSRNVFVSVLGPPTRHSVASLFWSRVRRRFPKPPHLLVHSPLTLRYYREIGNYSEKEVDLVHLPILDDFAPLQKNEESRDQKFTVGTFAPLTGQNNLNYFLTVAHCVIHQNSNIRFRLMGRGKLYSHLKRTIEALDLEESVDVEDLDDLRALKGMDVFLYLPLQNQHFIPLLAAIGAKIPVVSSEVLGIEDFITHGKSGYVVPVHSTAEMAGDILRLYKNAGYRREMGECLRRELEDHCGLATVLKHYQGLFFGRGGTSRIRAA